MSVLVFDREAEDVESLGGYAKKDYLKFQFCNKLISRGAAGSSSQRYSEEGIAGIELEVNSKKYTMKDVVGVSVNGKRSNRLDFDRDLVKLALESGSVIVCDSEYDRKRRFNKGERDLYDYVMTFGAKEGKFEYGSFFYIEDNDE